jgi:hypothetical protein
MSPAGDNAAGPKQRKQPRETRMMVFMCFSKLQVNESGELGDWNDSSEMKRVKTSSLFRYEVARD